MARSKTGLLALTLLLVTLSVFGPEARDSDEYDLSWYTIDGGGGESTGGDYILTGTVGQPDSAASSGSGPYWLHGGFWSLPQNHIIFADGFESGDTTAWSANIP